MIGRLLPWTIGTAAWNMAVDEAILTAYINGAAPLTIRFYGWDPPALSLGCFQNPLTERQLALCQRKKIDWVKRPTGGRAVFHADEITYSLITGERNDFFGPVLADYLRIGMGLKKGFELLGLPVQMSEKNRQQKVSHSQICFASQSWYEITCHGRKLVGSAQLRRERSLLQHGSILVTFDAKLLLELTEEGERPKSPLLADRLQQRVIGLKEALGYYPDKFRVISVLLKGLEEKLGIEWKEMPLTPDEVKLAKRLECEKYSRSSSLV